MHTINSKINVSEGKGYIVTFEGEWFEEIRKAQEKYGVKIPNVQLIIFPEKEICSFYQKIESFDGVVKHPLDWTELGENLKIEDILDVAIVASRKLSWGWLVEKYLAKKGIRYEA